MKPLPFKMRQETELEKWRAKTFWTKEPETIAWIDTFKPGELFFDVGANVGVYSLYAASRGVKVVAFEPHLANFAALSHNAALNDGLIYPCPFAVGERKEVAVFYPESAEAGSTGGQVVQGVSFDDKTVPMISLDYFSRLSAGPPDHVKIDIDGQEDAVVRGMAKMLKNGYPKTCLVEVSPANRAFIVKTFVKAGFRGHPLDLMTPHSRERRAQQGIMVENLIFTR